MTVLPLNVTIRIMHLINSIIVVVCQFLQGGNVFSSKKHNVRHALIIVIIEHVLSIEVRRAAVVDKPANISVLRCIDSVALLLHTLERCTLFQFRYTH